jgi:hypothetical protein
LKFASIATLSWSFSGGQSSPIFNLCERVKEEKGKTKEGGGVR